MTTVTARNLSVAKPLGYSPQDLPQPQSKSLGGGTQNPELAAWYLDAQKYYQGVMNGSIPAPTQAEWGQFIQWMEWADAQLWGSSSNSWGESFLPGEGAQNEEPQPDPSGGIPGTMGNTVHNKGSVELNYYGTGQVHDIWTYDFTLNVSPTSATVLVEQTEDTRFNPPETVIKITVKDDATGTEETYFLHDPEAVENFYINTPKGENVEDMTGLATVGSFEKSADQEPEYDPNSVMEPTQTGTNKYRYDVYYGQMGNFYFRPGEDSFHTIYGSANIVLLPSDRVDVYEGMIGGAPGNQAGWYSMVITHADGSKDTVHVKKGYDHNIDGHPTQIEWHETKPGEDPQGTLGLEGDGGPGGVIDEEMEDDNLLALNTKGMIAKNLTAGGDPIDPDDDEGWGDDDPWGDPDGGNVPPGGQGEGMDIPDAFDDSFTVGGVGDTVPPPDPNADIPQVIQDIAAAMGMNPNHIPEHLWPLFENATLPPNGNLLGTLAWFDPQLKAAIENLKQYPNHNTPDAAWDEVRNRLSELLRTVWPDTNGENLWELETEEARNTLYINGQAYTIGTQLLMEAGPHNESFFSVVLTTSDAEKPLTPEEETNKIIEEVGEIKYQDMLKVAESLASLEHVNLTPAQIVARAYNEWDMDLSNATFPPSEEIWKFLNDLDPRLFEYWKNVNSAFMDVYDKGIGDHTMIHHQVGLFVRHAADMLNKMYPAVEIEYYDDWEYKGGDGINNLHLITVDGDPLNILRGNYLHNGDNYMDIYNSSDWTDIFGWEYVNGEKDPDGEW